MGSLVKSARMNTLCFTAIFLLLSLSTNVSAIDCPDGWLDANIFEMGCLHLSSPDPMDWLKADIYCKNIHINGTLVEILSVEQMENLIMDLKFLEALDGEKSGTGSGAKRLLG